MDNTTSLDMKSDNFEALPQKRLDFTITIDS